MTYLYILVAYINNVQVHFILKLISLTYSSPSFQCYRIMSILFSKIGREVRRKPNYSSSLSKHPIYCLLRHICNIRTAIVVQHNHWLISLSKKSFKRAVTHLSFLSHSRGFSASPFKIPPVLHFSSSNVFLELNIFWKISKPFRIGVCIYGIITINFNDIFPRVYCILPRLKLDIKHYKMCIFHSFVNFTNIIY